MRLSKPTERGTLQPNRFHVPAWVHHHAVISAGPSCKCTYYSNISYNSLSFNTRRTNFHHINIQRLAVASNPICETKACTCTKS